METTTMTTETKDDPARVDPATVTWQRGLEVMRSHGDVASVSREPVRFTAWREARGTPIIIGIADHTEIRMSLDELVEAALTVCPPWLLRKKLGL